MRTYTHKVRQSISVLLSRYHVLWLLLLVHQRSPGHHVLLLLLLLRQLVLLIVGLHFEGMGQ